jgi:hypothetical protein
MYYRIDVILILWTLNIDMVDYGIFFVVVVV